MKYYVYTHIDPKTKEIVYVGKGTGGRAWDVTRCRSEHKDHQEWMQNLGKEGYLPCDWVSIELKHLSEDVAYAEEKRLLHSIGGTVFNRQSGERNYQAKLTNEQACEIYLSSEHSGILSRRFGVSRAAIQHIKKGTQWRAATAFIRNSQTPSLPPTNL